MKNKIITCIYSVGLIPILLFLKEQEEAENYEMCEIILSAIRQVYSADQNVPTKYSKLAEEWLTEQFDSVGLTQNFSLKNREEYIENIYRKLELERINNGKL